MHAAAAKTMSTLIYSEPLSNHPVRHCVSGEKHILAIDDLTVTAVTTKTVGAFSDKDQLGRQYSRHQHT